MTIKNKNGTTSCCVCESQKDLKDFKDKSLFLLHPRNQNTVARKKKSLSIGLFFHCLGNYIPNIR